MELKLDLHVRRNIEKNYKGFSDIFHDTITEEDLLEYMRERIKDQYNTVELDSITIVSITI